MSDEDSNLDPDALVALAETASRQGRLNEAEVTLRRALMREPQHPAASLLLGVTLAKQFRAAEALPVLIQVSSRDSHCYESRLWLSRIARKNGRAADSIAYALEASALAPNLSEVLINLGLAQIDVRNFDGAIDSLSRAASLTPSAALFLHLGTALQNRGRLSDAISAFGRAIELDPRMADAFLGLGQALLAISEFEGAGESAARAISLNPKSAAAHHLYLEVLLEANRPEEAELHARRFAVAFPGDSLGQALLGRCLLTVGKFDEGRTALEESVRLQPAQGTAYCLLAQSHKISAEDEPLVVKMESALKRDDLHPRERSYLNYGLGKAYEDLGNYPLAITHFDEANRMAYDTKFGPGKLDRGAYTARVDWAIQTLGRGFVDSNSPFGCPDETPIFIVGMIRSGTSLVEQILSSHPEVAAAGEQRFWQAHAPPLMAFGTTALDVTRLHAVCEAYRRILTRVGSGMKRVTDKMPGNYAWLPLLHVAFPNARIIHTMRHPVDTCVSIYTTPNSTPNEFAHDRRNIVFGYREYLRIMARWRDLLPSDRLFEVGYEDLVTDRERVTRRLVDFCGLDWSDDCLRPEASGRPVLTPSAIQVRQPVYNSSIARWQRYEGLLGPFTELLK